MRKGRLLAAAVAGIACGLALIAVAHSLPGAGAIPGESTAGEERERRDGDFLSFAFTLRGGTGTADRPGNLLSRIGVAGRSAQGRIIH
jgi:hypothetical protein